MYSDDEGAPGIPGVQIAAYEYDGRNRRVGKAICDENGDPLRVVEYLYDTSWRLLESRGVENSATSVDQYIWDQSYIDAPIVRYHDSNGDGDYADNGDTVLYYTWDANHNVTALVNTSGTVVERYVYDPYGKATVYSATWTNPATPGPTPGLAQEGPLFGGYMLDSETMLSLARNRYYHATLGQWITRDPIGYAENYSNLYTYVHNNPILFSDISGLFPTDNFTAEQLATIDDLRKKLSVNKKNFVKEYLDKIKKRYGDDILLYYIDLEEVVSHGELWLDVSTHFYSAYKIAYPDHVWLEDDAAFSIFSRTLDAEYAAWQNIPKEDRLQPEETRTSMDIKLAVGLRLVDEIWEEVGAGNNFKDTTGMISKLKAMLGRKGCIHKLTIVAHGSNGVVLLGENGDNITADPDGISGKYYTGKNIEETKANIESLRGMFCSGGASAEIRSCSSGDGEEGSRLLLTLAKAWNVPVTGYTETIAFGFADGMDTKTAYPDGSVTIRHGDKQEYWGHNFMKLISTKKGRLRWWD